MERPIHLDLMFHVDALTRSAVGRDVPALHAELRTVRNAFVDHIACESDEVESLSEAAAEVVRTGQQRLMSQIDELIGESDGETGDCNCVPDARRLGVLLRRQARIESGLVKAVARQTRTV